MSKKVSCLIPAFNEAPRIGAVLSVVSSFPGFDEVIVIDDGSSDGTSEVAAGFPVKVITHSENKGKAAAIFTGFQQSTGDIIVMIDSDLLGLEHHNLQELINPVLHESCLSMSLRANTWKLFRLEGVDPWSGERAFPREVLAHVFQDKTIAKKKYAIESYINEIVMNEGWPIFSIPWPNVRYVLKGDKEKSFWHGLVKELKMHANVYWSFGILKTVTQQIMIPRLLKK